MAKSDTDMIRLVTDELYKRLVTLEAKDVNRVWDVVRAMLEIVPAAAGDTVGACVLGFQGRDGAPPCVDNVTQDYCETTLKGKWFANAQCLRDVPRTSGS